MSNLLKTRESRPLHTASPPVFNQPLQPCVTRQEEGGIIPDSEEERLRLTNANEGETEVIEISSDERDDCTFENKTQMSSLDEIASVNIPGRCPLKFQDAATTDTTSESFSEDAATSQPVPSTSRRRNMQTPRARRIIQSSSSEDSDAKARLVPKASLHELLTYSRTPFRSTRPVIDLTLSSPECNDSDHEYLDMSAQRPPGAWEPSLWSATSGAGGPKAATQIATVSFLHTNDVDAFHDSGNVNDGSVLTLDEPRSARKPIRSMRSPASTVPGPSIPRRGAALPARISGPDSESDTPLKTQVAYRLPGPSATPRKAVRAPRMTKSALAAAEQARREAYARNLFNELNGSVFGCGIPQETQLKWSKRLLTTAGKARWHKSRDGAQTCEIQLAIKILDSDERIRNTLSHEMCHLACWIINGDPKEGHGKIFKGWATKVMRARPDIEVTTKHNYEISYKYEWKCQECDKIYGRHSKSIRPDECVCGACRVGRLVPLFDTPQRAPKTPRKTDSQMAATKSRDSPRTIALPALLPKDLSISENVVETSARPEHRRDSTHPKSITVVDTDYKADSDVEVLAHVLGAVSLTDPTVGN
ncbi:hypothetical protein AcW1_000231 [Taiwanofungus camphoratus]|nr:hypothetical protein AcW1_000231 [Antrodia cinnamomea]